MRELFSLSSFALSEFCLRISLGLGATVSQSSLATSREAAKLKGKLIGQKRRRDESNDNTRAMGAQGPYNGQDEDEGESRSSAISTKKPRVIRIFGKKPEDAESSIISKKQSTAGNSLDLPSTPTHVSPGAPNHTLPTTSSITCLNSSAESSPASAPHQAHSRLSSQSVPLLNLDGPPLVQMGNEMLAHPQEGASPKKKKRRRRRRKGRKGGGGEEAA